MRCPSWTGVHTCMHPDADHLGDHQCGGCGDVWNRDAVVDAQDAAGAWDHERPDPSDLCR